MIGYALAFLAGMACALGFVHWIEHWFDNDPYL